MRWRGDAACLRRPTRGLRFEQNWFFAECDAASQRIDRAGLYRLVMMIARQGRTSGRSRTGNGRRVIPRPDRQFCGTAARRYCDGKRPDRTVRVGTWCRGPSSRAASGNFIARQPVNHLAVGESAVNVIGSASLHGIAGIVRSGVRKIVTPRAEIVIAVGV